MRTPSTSFSDRLFLEKALSEHLKGLGAPDVSEITFRKQSHNAVVYQGVMSDEPVFIKKYETDYGRRLVEKAVEETGIVLGHFKGRRGGIAQIEWAAPEARLVVMSQAPGIQLPQAAQDSDRSVIHHQVAQWLQDYVGPRVEADKYPTRYWYKKRMETNLEHLNVEDRALVGDLMSLQRARAKGPITMISGRVPSDFAPHNLHWADGEIFGFDIEGYSRQPLARAAVWFAVLASKNVMDTEDRRFGLPTNCIAPFMEVLDVGVDDDRLWVYLTADLLFYRFVKRYDDVLVRKTLRQAIRSHLETSTPV